MAEREAVLRLDEQWARVRTGASQAPPPERERLLDDLIGALLTLQDIPNTIDFRAGWQRVPDNGEFDNAFKIQWEMFLKHVAGVGEDFPWDLLEGAKGVQLAELAQQSIDERRWVDIPELRIPQSVGAADQLPRL